MQSSLRSFAHLSRVGFCLGVLSIASGMLALAENATAGVITLGSVPDAYAINNQRVLYFDNGSSLSFANYPVSQTFGWQFYNMSAMMGSPASAFVWTLSNSTTHRFDSSSSLVAGLSSIGPSSTPTSSFGQISTSFSNRYFGLIYEAGGGNYNYGWANLSYDASSEIATMNSAAMETTVNQAITVGVVPEPSTCIMALAGLACGGYSLFRRRRAR